MKHYSLFLIILFLFGCKTEELCNSRLDSYPSVATEYFSTFSAEGKKIDFKIQYNSQGQVIKRIGGITNSFTFTENIYDSIIYVGDTIRILNIYWYPFENQIFRNLQSKTDIVLSENGNFKTIYRNSGFATSFFYNKNNQIVNKLTYCDNCGIDLTWNTTYTYSVDGNLALSKTIFIDKTNNVNDTTIEEFSNYDNAPNPFKPLRIFDDTFLRSLSENNYKKSNYTGAGTGNNEWEFNYDNCGNLKFSK